MSANDKSVEVAANRTMSVLLTGRFLKRRAGRSVAAAAKRMEMTFPRLDI